MKAHSRVLEIGAGSGHQASLLEYFDHEVEAIDVSISNHLIYPITEFDGVNIRSLNNYFDYVFSSNVLEHVVHLDKLQKEIYRALKPEGLAIHILPTHTWRLWAILFYYVALPKPISDVPIHLKGQGQNVTAPYSLGNSPTIISSLTLTFPFLYT